MSTEAAKDVERKVRDHFEHDIDAERFRLRFIKGKRGLPGKFIDDFAGAAVQKRLKLNVENCSRSGKILDVGCGSGRFCIAFA